MGGLNLDAETIPKVDSPENIKEPLTIFDKISNIPQPLLSNNYDVVDPYVYDYLSDSLTQPDYDMVITQQDVCRMDRYQLYTLETYSIPDPYMPYVHGKYIPDPNSPDPGMPDLNIPDFISIRPSLIYECLPLRPVFMSISILYFSPILTLSIKILLGSVNLKGVVKASKLAIKSIKKFNLLTKQ